MSYKDFEEKIMESIKCSEENFPEQKGLKLERIS